MERLDSKMQAFEETAEVQRQEIEMNERVLEDFEDWIEKEKNEGMFFKSLGKVKPWAHGNTRAYNCKCRLRNT